MTTPTFKYTLVHPSGDIQTCRIPKFFTAFDVVHKLQHSVVFIEVPSDSTAWDAGSKQFVQGPCVLLVTEHDTFRVPRLPRDDKDAYMLESMVVPASV